jgi:glycosidase
MASIKDLHNSHKPVSLTEVQSLLKTACSGDIKYFPSPIDWRNEVLYFLLPDRFSDGNEKEENLLTRSKIRELRKKPNGDGIDLIKWGKSGKNWQGGTIKGIGSKLDYIQQLGISAIWIGPIFKQRERLDTYHGYGVQDFLDVDPRFGKRMDLYDLVIKAHKKNIKVILDVIINHSGDNWGYLSPNQAEKNAGNEPPYRCHPDFYGNPNNPETQNWSLVWRDEMQVGYTKDTNKIIYDNEGVWPKDMQDTALYTRAGKGDLGKNDIKNSHAEHKRTDFYSLKDFALDVPRNLSILVDCFKYWIALFDIDGFRIDTVKHISLEEARNFCGAIREFADMLGKHNFLLLGEIAGGDDNQDYVLDNLAILQRNMSAALDIGTARLNIQAVSKGLAWGNTYLNGFDSSSAGFDSHRSFGNRHVSIVDDHDHVMGEKIRFSAEIPDDSMVKDYQVVVATAFQLFTLGIPCIYYGTEQAFAGPANSQVQLLIGEGWKDPNNSGDRYLREAMFGPEHPRGDFRQDIEQQLNTKDITLPGFGPFGTCGKHCFDITSPSYIRIASLCKVRSRYLVFCLGRQYPRQIRNFNKEFDFPMAGEIVAWSRILDHQEALCIVNPNGNDNALLGGDIIVSSELWDSGKEFTVIANTAQDAARVSGNSFTGTHPVGSKVKIKGQDRPNEPAFVEIRKIPPAEILLLICV